MTEEIPQLSTRNLLEERIRTLQIQNAKLNSDLNDYKRALAASESRENNLINRINELDRIRPGL